MTHSNMQSKLELFTRTTHKRIIQVPHYLSSPLKYFGISSLMYIP